MGHYRNKFVYDDKTGDMIDDRKQMSMFYFLIIPRPPSCTESESSAASDVYKRQQQLAQRLIGYQSKDYLENLFVNDVSQYKFYQGYIREKGTQAAIDKLLKARYEGSDIELNLYPEWMIRTGVFGNTDSKERVQITLSDYQVSADPLSIVPLDYSADVKEYRRSLKVVKEDLYSKPIEYTASSTFSLIDYTQEGVDRDKVQVYKTAGYPQLDQVQHTAFDVSDLLNLAADSITNNGIMRWTVNAGNLTTSHQISGSAKLFTYGCTLSGI